MATRDKEGHYILIKVPVHHKDITTVNKYITNIRACKYIKQIPTNLKGVMENDTILIEGFNTPLSATDRSSRQIINKKTELNHTVNQMEFMDIYMEHFIQQ